MDSIRWHTVGDNQDVLVTTAHETFLYAHLDDGQHHDGVFLDIGAHRGKYTVPLAHRYRRVYAVEPDPAQRTVLHQNLELNQITNVVVIPVAAWDTDQSVALEQRPGTARVVSGTGIQAKRLDDILPDLDYRLVKIDTEGAEAKVLAGMAKLVDRSFPKLVVEMHDRLFPEMVSADEVTGFLDDHGYLYEDLNYNRDIHYIVTKGPA